MQIIFQIDVQQAVRAGRSVPATAAIDVDVEALTVAQRELLAQSFDVRAGAIRADKCVFGRNRNLSGRLLQPAGTDHAAVVAALDDLAARFAEADAVAARDEAERAARDAARTAERREAVACYLRTAEEILPDLREVVGEVERVGGDEAVSRYRGIVEKLDSCAVFGADVFGVIVDEVHTLRERADRALREHARTKREAAEKDARFRLAEYCGFEGEDAERFHADLMPAQEVIDRLHARTWEMLGVGDLGLTKRPRFEQDDLACDCGCGLVTRSSPADMDRQTFSVYKRLLARIEELKTLGVGTTFEVSSLLVWGLCKQEDCEETTPERYRVLRVTVTFDKFPSTWSKLVRDFVPATTD